MTRPASPAWPDGVRKEAAQQGISAKTIAALDGIAFAPDVVAKDRAQNVFSQSFLEFSDRMVAKYRLQKGAQLIKSNAKLFDRIEKDYGVPAAALAASGAWRPISAPISATCRRCARWRRLPMIADARSSSTTS